VTDVQQPAEGYASGYVAHHVPGEHARLHTLEAKFDPATIRVLSRLDLPHRRPLPGTGRRSRIGRRLAGQSPPGAVGGKRRN
jgi:hypothetical protein